MVSIKCATPPLDKWDQHLRILAMDQSLDRVAIVIEHEHDWIQAQLQHVGKRLHSEMQATLAGDKDTSLEVTALFDGFERSYCGAGSVADAAEDCLVVHAGTAGEF